MVSIDSDGDDTISRFSTEDNDSRNNKQAPSSQKDLFEDDDSDSNIDEQENKLVQLQNKLQLLPAVAVPEKIVFCIDRTVDMAGGYLFEDSQQPPDTHSIRDEAIRVFITNKLSIARDTEFALISLMPGKAELVSSLSSNIEQFLSSLAGLKNVPVGKLSEYDITPMFNIVNNVIDMPQEPKTTVIPPNYIVRLILIYGNSFSEPNVNIASEFYKKFIFSPFCFLDIFYLHDKLSDNVEQIFKYFVKITSEKSYLLENARNVTTLFNKMSKLLAHPCQRVSQEMWPF